MKRIWQILVAMMLVAALLLPTSVVAKAKVKVAIIVEMAPAAVVTVDPKFIHEPSNELVVAIDVTFRPSLAVEETDVPPADNFDPIIEGVVDEVARTGVGKKLVALTVASRTVKGDKPFIHAPKMFLGRHRMNC